MITRHKPPKKRRTAAKGTSRYRVMEAGTQYAKLVVTTTFPAKLVEEKNVRHAGRTEGVAMYEAEGRPRYLVARFTRPAKGARSYLHWNHTNSKTEARAMFENLLKIAQSND